MPGLLNLQHLSEDYILPFSNETQASFPNSLRSQPKNSFPAALTHHQCWRSSLCRSSSEFVFTTQPAQVWAPVCTWSGLKVFSAKLYQQSQNLFLSGFCSHLHSPGGMIHGSCDKVKNVSLPQITGRADQCEHARCKTWKSHHKDNLNLVSNHSPTQASHSVSKGFSWGFEDTLERR